MRPNRIDPVRFSGTAMATPVIIAVLGFPFGAFFAVVFGFWAYLFLGLPCFWVVLRWSPLRTPLDNAALLAGAGYLANFGTNPLYLHLPEIMVPLHKSERLVASIADAGKVYAPIFGLVFGLIYRPLQRTTGA